jgi:shikimate kinase
LRDENRQLLSVAGPVVWLTATPATNRRRLSADPLTELQRPGLCESSQGGATTALDEIERVLEQRLPIYRQCADVTIATDDASPAEIAEAVLSALDLRTPGGLS